MRRLDGQPDLTLSSLHGQVVVLDVWATWCEACVEALPALQRLEDAHPGVRVLALSINKEPGDVVMFAQRHNLRLTVLYEHVARRVAQALNVNILPSTFVLDRQGRLRARHEGLSGQGLTKLNDQVEALLAEP
jgi:cytochrome c biogenesis protein CcmG, thiol:disulfide interchange protein DsbE